MTVEFFIPGPPKAQPRPRATIRGGKAGVYNPKTSDGWKMQVSISARAQRLVVSGPVELILCFTYPRPASHFGARGLKASAPKWHTQKPDVDNLAKSTLDAMVACGFLKDDKIVCSLLVKKTWGDVEGCQVSMTLLDEQNKVGEE